jgi:hypothetical protein
LVNFRVKTTAAANEVYGALGAGQHDDLVLAVALAVWQAEREPPPLGKPFAVVGRPPAPGPFPWR